MEVTDVVEVEGPVYHGISEVMQEIQVTAAPEQDKLPREEVEITTETTEQSQVQQDSQTQGQSSVETDMPKEADDGGTKQVSLDPPENITYQVMLTSEGENQGENEHCESSQVTTLPQALNGSPNNPSGEDGVAAEVISVTEVAMETTDVSGVVEIDDKAVAVDHDEGSSKQATIITAEGNESAGFDGPGNVPLMQDDVVVEGEVNENTADPVAENSTDVVMEVAGVNEADDQPPTEGATSVEVTHEAVSAQEEMGEILAPSSAETKEAESATVQDQSNSEPVSQE